MENHSNFDIDEAEIIKKKGNKYYIIPEHTLIYRGGNISDLRDNAFFGFNVDHVKQYGNVSEYKTNKQLKVLALMEMDTNSKFYKSAPENIKNALNEAYSYNKPERVRVSNPTDDYGVVNYLCDEKYHGYAMHSNYKTDSGSKFHAELVICNCTQHTDMINANIEKTSEPPRIKRKRKMKSPLPAEENNTSPPRSIQTPARSIQTPPRSIQTPARSIQTPPRSPSTPVQRKLSFGGKSKRKSKRKTRKRKTRKRSKQTKKVKH